MTRARVTSIVALVLLAAALAWGLFVGLPRWVAGHRTSSPPPPPPAAATAEPERKIRARLFYVSDDGHALTGVEREVTYGADPAAQARAILEAQLAEPAAPLVSAIPAGTKVRAVYVAGADAYVDLTNDVVTAHPGGSLNEALTVQTVVAAITANLPAVTRVQMLVEGKEVDSLSGHIDLRQPLTRSDDWVR